MLTANDLEQIANLVSTLLKPIEQRLMHLEAGQLEIMREQGEIRKEQEKMKKEMKSINRKLNRLQRDVSYISGTFDQSIVDLQRRVIKVENRISL